MDSAAFEWLLEAFERAYRVLGIDACDEETIAPLVREQAASFALGLSPTQFARLVAEAGEAEMPDAATCLRWLFPAKFEALAARLAECGDQDWAP